MTERDQKIINNMHVVEEFVTANLDNLQIDKEEALSLGYEILIKTIDAGDSMKCLKRRLVALLKRKSKKNDIPITEYSDMDDIFCTQAIEEALSDILTERENAVIHYRFYQKLTLEQVSKIYCVTRECIRFVESKAIRKIQQHPEVLKKLRGFYGVANW